MNTFDSCACLKDFAWAELKQAVEKKTMQSSFAADHRSTLTCLCEALKGSTSSKLCEPVVDALVRQNPHLGEEYPEVAVLLLAFHLRKSARALHGCLQDAHNDNTTNGTSPTIADNNEQIVTTLQNFTVFLHNLSELLPDPCFVVLAQMCTTLLANKKELEASTTALQQQRDSEQWLLSVLMLSEQISEVGLQVSHEMLRATSSLVHRCDSLSLYFRDVFPFCKVE